MRRQRTTPGSSRPSGGAGSRRSSPRDPATMSQSCHRRGSSRGVAPERAAGAADEQLRRGDGRRARLERRRRGSRRGRRHRAHGRPSPARGCGSSTPSRSKPSPSWRAGSSTSSSSTLPPASGSRDLLALPGAGGGYLHHAWGEAERRFCLSVLDQHLARRPALISVFRALREAGDCERRAAPRSAGRPRNRGSPPGGGGALLPGPDRARAGAGSARCGRRHGRGRILR